ncbi:MAG: hypothetical protein V7K77_06250 [Nostoc sp.]|uniref:hypothetical protein n=1 Tax=Nostoc sp. TaxID=1180 RepID=UPI002FF724A5
MAFNQERFDRLIQKLEVFANKQPHLYKLHVAFLATLGIVTAIFHGRRDPKSWQMRI